MVTFTCPQGHTHTCSSLRNACGIPKESWVTHRSIAGRTLCFPLNSTVSVCVAQLAAALALQVVGNIHGNEQANREVLLRLVHHLADGYSRRRRVTQLLDNVNIHILPSMNPGVRSARDGVLPRVTESVDGIDAVLCNVLCCSPWADVNIALDHKR